LEFEDLRAIFPQRSYRDHQTSSSIQTVLNDIFYSFMMLYINE